MAEKGQTIIIKKINITIGSHGGAWKVAFADFMTAMMAFFLVMWLLNQSEETKKQVASYFSGPSMLEHQFTSYGAELTLDKLFVDLVNEPLGTLQKLLQPPDFTPNILAMGTKKIALRQMADILGSTAKNVKVEDDMVSFEIDDFLIFELGTAKITGQFIPTLEKVRKLTEGLENAEVQIDSILFEESVPSRSFVEAQRVAMHRGHILKKYIANSLEHESVEVKASPFVKRADMIPPSGIVPGKIIFTIKQVQTLPDGSKPRKLEDSFGFKEPKMDEYDAYLKTLSQQKRRPNSKNK